MWKFFLALFRLDLDAVCSESRYMPLHDFHALADSKEGGGVSPKLTVHRCQRCDKAFLL